MKAEGVGRGGVQQTPVSSQESRSKVGQKIWLNPVEQEGSDTQ